jgi:hypothetical protein
VLAIAVTLAKLFIVRCGDSGNEANDPSGELACNPPPVVVVTEAVVVESDPLSRSRST